MTFRLFHNKWHQVGKQPHLGEGDLDVGDSPTALWVQDAPRVRPWALLVFSVTQRASAAPMQTTAAMEKLFQVPGNSLMWWGPASGP